MAVVAMPQRGREGKGGRRTEAGVRREGVVADVAGQKIASE